MKASMFYLPTCGTRADIEAGMAGLRRELYQRMLVELGEQIRLGDRLGYDSVCFTEHHFHIEGFELSNNPVLLDLWAAMQTERIRVGQLGIVLPAENPIRVAENIAMLDHMSGGRAYAGFARGYQRRWVDTLAQQAHGVRGVQPHQHDAVDEANRKAFEECYRIVKRAWTEDLMSVQVDFWRIPVEGSPWPLESTQRYGGGVTNGVVTAVGPVPQTSPASPSSGVPAVRVVGALGAVVRRGRGHRGAAAVAPAARTASRRPLRRDVGAGAGRWGRGVV